MTQHRPQTPASLELSDLVVGLSVVERFRISREEIDQFAEFSGDYSPLHMSDDFARAKGYTGRVVHGALLVAHLSRAIGMRLPGERAVWTGLTLSFRHPVIAGEEVSLQVTVNHVSQAARVLEVSIVATACDRRAVTGTAEILVSR